MAGLRRRTNVAKAVRGRTPEQPSLQAQRSAQTRLQFIQATIRCIQKYGYAHTTTLNVAAEAGLSRGAMIHHFENGLALIRATIEHLHEKRLRAFQRAVDSLEDRDDVRGLVMGYWSQVTNPTFIVFHELAIAARTDQDLAKILVPAQREFNEQWYQLAIELFPDWQSDRKRFDLALALSRNTLEGMAINQLTYGLDHALVEQLLDHLEQQIRSLHPPSPQARKTRS